MLPQQAPNLDDAEFCKRSLRISWKKGQSQIESKPHQFYLNECRMARGQFMAITLSLSAADLDNDDLQDLTRRLCRDLTVLKAYVQRKPSLQSHWTSRYFPVAPKLPFPT